MAAPLNGAPIERTHRASAPGSIEADLKALWMDVARDTPVARALMANLVVFFERQRGERIDFEAPIRVVPIDSVIRRHPSRVILLHHSPTDAGERAPIAAAVSVVTFGTDRTRYGVEEIAVRCACVEASLPSIVRNLAHGDVPTSIWWTEDISRTPPVGPLIAMGRQLVYDSRRWRDVRRAVLALAPFVAASEPKDVADINWRRLTAMRRALVHAAGTMVPRATAPDDARIVHRPGEGALGWLLAGWLASRGVRPAGSAIPLHVEESRHGDEIVAVTIGTIKASMNAQRVVVKGGGAPPFHLAVRQESEADAVVAELGSLRHDVCLHDTLVALARHFGEA